MYVCHMYFLIFILKLNTNFCNHKNMPNANLWYSYTFNFFQCITLHVVLYIYIKNVLTSKFTFFLFFSENCFIYNPYTKKKKT